MIRKFINSELTEMVVIDRDYYLGCCFDFGCMFLPTTIVYHQHEYLDQNLRRNWIMSKINMTVLILTVPEMCLLQVFPKRDCG